MTGVQAEVKPGEVQAAENADGIVVVKNISTNETL